MTKWTCACGLKEMWTPFKPDLPACVGCNSCRTGLAKGSGYRAPLEPHVWVVAGNGQPRQCERCGSYEQET